MNCRFMQVIEDPEFNKKYPELNKWLGSAWTDEEQAEDSKEDGKFNIEEEPQKDKSKFFSGIKKFTDFSAETLIEIQRYAKGYKSDALAYKFAENMKLLLRKKRELETKETPKNMSIPYEMACRVKDMTCVKFPAKAHCAGIAIGRCFSVTNLNKHSMDVKVI